MNKKIVSIPTGEIELVAIHEVNPLISKCQIKVCYVSDEPNRNKTVINKETAKKLAVSLRGCPIVGKYNEETKDFENHNEFLSFNEDGDLVLKTDTTPYGFVDLNAPIWFQKFIDEGIEREYLVTEGWLWTEQFPECKRIITDGNNQSMELPQKFLSGFWAEPDNLSSKFFIINDGLISKLCVLGEEVEPCFEGAQIAVNFSLNADFQQKTFALMEKIQSALEGGQTKMFEYTLEQLQATPEYQALQASLDEANAALEERNAAYSALETEKNTLSESLEAEQANNATLTASLTETRNSLDAANENVNTLTSNLEGKTSAYAALETQYNEVNEKYSTLESEVVSLREFKLNADRAEKEAMIAKFHMLSEEEKADVVSNMDTYSLDEIESKLAVIGVRKGINFSLEDDTHRNLNFNINSTINNTKEEDLPEWVKEVQKNK